MFHVSPLSKLKLNNLSWLVLMTCHNQKVVRQQMKNKGVNRNCLIEKVYVYKMLCQIHC